MKESTERHHKNPKISPGQLWKTKWFLLLVVKQCSDLYGDVTVYLIEQGLPRYCGAGLDSRSARWIYLYGEYLAG
jgi:hypothetical protein